MPAFSSPRPATLGRRPVANSTWSASITSPVVVVTAMADPLAGEGGGIDVEPQIDSALAHLLAEHVAQVPVEAAQRQLARGRAVITLRCRGPA